MAEKWFLFSEKDSIAFELIARILSLGAEPIGLVLGTDAKERATAYVARGCTKVFVSTISEPFAVLSQLVHQEKTDTVLIGSTRRGKELAVRLAQKLDAGCITDAIDVRLENNVLVADRFSFGGATIATETVLVPPRIIAVLPYTFSSIAPDITRKGEIIEIATEPLEPELKVLDRRKKETESVRLEDAEIIIGVGKGVKKKDDLGPIMELATMLKAELGCTRALAMDYKWLSEERVIGLSGKKTAPQLYVAIGISGQTQHTVGIMRAKTIVAINRDPEAPIFKIADYGLVGDWYKLVPSLVEAMKR